MERARIPSPPVIVAPERSGLYYLWVKTPSGEAFSFPWVVAPAQPREKIAVLASTNTWNAYNNYGGRSNYIHPAGLPESPLVNARQELDRYREGGSFASWRWKDEQFLPLSFDRPEPHNNLFDDPEVTDPRPKAGSNAVWRWPSGACWAGSRTRGLRLRLLRRRRSCTTARSTSMSIVLMLSIHPEYWTREMYFAVKRTSAGSSNVVEG